MKSAASLPPHICMLVISFGISIFANDVLLDDHQDETNANELEGYWNYYDDERYRNNNDRPYVAPISIPSQIDVEYEEWERLYQFTLDRQADNAFATMPFTFGEAWETTYGMAMPSVGIFTRLAPGGMYLDLNNAGGFRFKIRSRVHRHIIIFKVETADITLDSTEAFYQYPFSVNGDWVEVSVAIDSLRQPAWTPAGKQRPPDLTKVDRLVWELIKESESDPSVDTIDLDDIYITGYFTTYVKILINDILGRKVATLLDSDLAPGSRRSTLLPLNNSPGVYLCRIRTDRSERVKIIRLQ